MKKRALLCSLGLALLLVAPPSAAQGPGGKPSTAEADALTDKARQLFEEGVKALLASRWAEAHASFLAAWRIKPHYQIASNLGVAELRLGKHRDAAEHLTWYLREAPTTRVEERLRAEAWLKQARSRVASIKVVVAPEGAEVSVDGAPIGVAPIDLPVFVDPGEHTFAARLDGYESGKQTIAAAAGGSAAVEMTLERPAVAPPPSSTATAAAPPPQQPPAGASTEGDPEYRRNMILFGSSITAGAAAVTGIVFTVLAVEKASEAERVREGLLEARGSGACAGTSPAPNCAVVSDTYDAADTLGNLAFWSFVGAGLAGAGTVIYAMATRSGAPSARVRAVPVASPHGGGLWVGGNF